jgi:hypothetical protein
MMLTNIGSRIRLPVCLLAWAFQSRRPALPSGLASIFAPVLGGAGVIAGLYLFLRGFQLLQRKRWIEDTPITKIAGAAMGQVKVSGTATGPYTLLSPLAAVDCYYYRAVARGGRDAQDEDEREFEQQATETVFAPFFVKDETGCLMIDPRGAQIEMPAEYDEPISGSSTTEGVRRFLRRHGLSTTGATTVSEYAIKPGDPLLVLGTLGASRGLGSMSDPSMSDPSMSDPEARGGVQGAYLSREAADLQRREQLEAMGVLNTDMPGFVPDLASDEPDRFDLHPSAVLCAGDDRQPFVLSRTTPQRMIDKLARSSIIDIWGGAALALFSLGIVMKWLAT